MNKQLVEFYHPNMSAVLPIVILICHSLVICEIELVLLCFCHLCIFFGEVSVQIFLSGFSRVFFFFFLAAPRSLWDFSFLTSD